jgi:leucyl aminopeptidase (aminopeptidase T)
VVERGKNRCRVTNRAGTDVTFRLLSAKEREERLRARGIVPGRPRRGGMLGGQGSLNANPKTVEGVLVFDGAFWPPSEVGALKEPLEMKVEAGKVTEIVSDHHEARIVKNWFAHFMDPDAYSILHVSTGFNPGVKRISGDIVEDERVFGCVEMGIGLASPNLACHTDGIILDPSIWIDDELIEKDGIFVEPKLKELATKLGMQLWVD